MSADSEDRASSAEPLAASAESFAFRLSALRQAYPIRLGLARREVLHGIDLALERGTSLGLVGPNGSGKSTLLRVLAGIETPRSGERVLFGSSPERSATRRRIGFMPEDSPYPGEWSARHVLELVASMQRVERKKLASLVDEWLERVGLGASAHMRLGRFSRGMKRRFDLAAALIHGPDLVLLDEPTAGLDALGFGVLESLLAETKQRGASLVIASHLLTDVHAHCERLVVLVDGRIAFEGTPRSLWEPKERLTFEIEGLNETDVRALEQFARTRGGRIVACHASSASLAALYRRFGARPKR